MSCRRADYFTLFDVRSNRLPSAYLAPQAPRNRAARPYHCAPGSCAYYCAPTVSDCTSFLINMCTHQNLSTSMYPQSSATATTFDCLQ